MEILREDVELLLFKLSKNYDKEGKVAIRQKHQTNLHKIISL